METKTLSIAGMSCQHCVMHVKKELAKVATVKDVQIGSAVIEFDPASTDTEALKAADAATGYEVVDIS